jgi:hypothetical protein
MMFALLILSILGSATLLEESAMPFIASSRSRWSNIRLTHCTTILEDSVPVQVLPIRRATLFLADVFVIPLLASRSRTAAAMVFATQTMEAVPARPLGFNVVLAALPAPLTSLVSTMVTTAVATVRALTTTVCASRVRMASLTSLARLAISQMRRSDFALR